MAKSFTLAQARYVGNRLGVDWRTISVATLRRGMNVELEHGRAAGRFNVTDDDALLTAKIAMGHLTERGDYYAVLARAERAAKPRRKPAPIAPVDNGRILRGIVRALIEHGADVPLETVLALDAAGAEGFAVEVSLLDGWGESIGLEAEVHIDEYIIAIKPPVQHWPWRRHYTRAGAMFQRAGFHFVRNGKHSAFLRSVKTRDIPAPYAFDGRQKIWRVKSDTSVTAP